MYTCFVCSLNYARCMNESESFYLVIECQGSLWNPLHHLPVQVQALLYTLLDNFYARYDLYDNIGLKPIVFQTFSISFWILKQDKRCGATALVSAGLKSAKSLQGQSYVMQKTSLFLFKWKRIFKFVFILGVCE